MNIILDYHIVKIQVLNRLLFEKLGSLILLLLCLYLHHIIRYLFYLESKPTITVYQDIYVCVIVEHFLAMVQNSNQLLRVFGFNEAHARAEPRVSDQIKLYPHVHRYCELQHVWSIFINPLRILVEPICIIGLYHVSCLNH